jgi:protein-serine/threonine kinase
MLTLPLSLSSTSPSSSGSVLVPMQFLRRVASTPSTKATLEDAIATHPGGTIGTNNNHSSISSSPLGPSAVAKSNSSIHSTMTTSSMTTTATGSTVGNNSFSPSSSPKLNGGGLHLNIPKSPNGSALDLRRGAFRRTYSSNSIKKKTVEVTPSSFVKIRLLGKGDVGKVYLVRQKDTDRLYAMKGMLHISLSVCVSGGVVAAA